MKSTPLIVRCLAVLALAAGLIFIGCEGEPGPAGAQGPEGPQGPGGPPGNPLASGYLGNNAVTCGHCHSQLTGHWAETGHAEAYVSLTGENSTNPYCLQCHTTGFDSEFDHDGNLVSTGPDTTGYDNRPVAELQGVQCESCHGPMGMNPSAHTPNVEASLAGETCGGCHEQMEELELSGHGTAVERAGGQAAFMEEFGRSSCAPCHISEGFIVAKDMDHAGGLTYTNALTCATCHDPHEANNPAQLRTIGAATSPYSALSPTGYQITGLGKGQLCAQCHHARRNEANITGQLNNGSAHPGPHESPQTDMVLGQGSWEIAGSSIDRDTLHSTSLLPNMCVDCHMFQVARAPGVTPVLGHEFEPDIRKCQTCHPGATDFDIGGVQTTTHNLITQLEALLPHDSTGAVMHSMDTLNWTYDQRQAGYIYFFVEADGSHGVHNRDYTHSLLQSAIDLLTPGIAARPAYGTRD